MSPATKVAFALPHHPTQENLPHHPTQEKRPHPTQEKRKKVDRKVKRRSENDEQGEGECEKAEKVNCEKGRGVEQQLAASERGEEGRVKENLSSSESSTFSDGEEDNPPFIRWGKRII